MKSLTNYQWHFFIEQVHMIKKSVQNTKVKTVLRKNKAINIILPDFKLYYKLIVIKTIWFWHKNRQIMEQNWELRDKGEKEVSFHQKASNLGKGGLVPPKKQVWRSYSITKILKGKGEWSQLVTGVGVRVVTVPHAFSFVTGVGVRVVTVPHAFSFVTFLRSLFSCYLVHTVCSWGYWRGSWGRGLVTCWLLNLHFYFFGLWEEPTG